MAASTSGGGEADPRVRVRILAFLLENGLPLASANRVARKVVWSMVAPGAMHQAAVKLAGTAVGKAPKGEMRAAVLVEPKAEPYETAGGGAIGTVPGVRFGGPGGMGKGPVPGRTGLVIGKGPIPTFRGKTDRAHTTGVPFIRTGSGATTNFAIIEPILERREVHGWIGREFSPVQVKELANQVDGAVRLN